MGETALAFMTEDPPAVIGIPTVENPPAPKMLFPTAVKIIGVRQHRATGLEKPAFDRAVFQELDADPSGWPDARGARKIAKRRRARPPPDAVTPAAALKRHRLNGRSR
ncbi:MAG: hypothetical protein AAF192_02920 [Pseudomonadota bacterium]